MSNKVTFGLDKVYVAFIDEGQAQPAWGTPVHIPGAVKFSPSPQGNESPFYADNTIYYSHASNNGYTAELEMANVLDEVLAEMLGLTIDANGMIIETAEGVGKEFALMGQIQGDKKNRRFVYYRCKASRPGKEHATATEGVTPATDVLSLTILPIEYNDEKLIKGVMELSETNTEVYNTFFDAVTMPAEGGQ